MPRSSTPFRTLTRTEREILNRLLEAQFPGRDELYEQLENCLVRTIDEEGSLEFKVASAMRAPVTRRIPVEAETRDEDGIPVLLLLHVVEGFVREFEVVKGDGSPMVGELKPSGIRIVTVRDVTPD